MILACHHGIYKRYKEEALILMWLNKRTEDRKEISVEGKHEA